MQTLSSDEPVVTEEVINSLYHHVSNSGQILNFIQITTVRPERDPVVTYAIEVTMAAFGLRHTFRFALRTTMAVFFREVAFRLEQAGKDGYEYLHNQSADFVLMGNEWKAKFEPRYGRVMLIGEESSKEETNDQTGEQQ